MNQGKEETAAKTHPEERNHRRAWHLGEGACFARGFGLQFPKWRWCN